MSNNDNHIREAAYYIWENEGRPNGMDSEHWNKAKTALTRTVKAKPTVKVSSKKKTTTKRTATKKRTSSKKR